MSISPYSLNMLYQNGILDYIPMELASPSPIGGMSWAQNPYMNSAMSGAAFQNYGQSDQFVNTTNSNISFDNSSIGIKSNAASNAFGLQGIGSRANTDFYGLNVGAKSDAAYNAFGLGGIGTRNTNTEMNAWGISGGTQQQVGQFMSSVTSSSVLKPLIGLGLLLIAGLSIKKAFTPSGKKAAKKAAKEVTETVTEKKGWKSKFNPKNWNIWKTNKKKKA